MSFYLSWLPMLNAFRPQNYQELFNLCHAQAHNVFEWIFGVVKKKFWIMVVAPEYPLLTQSKLVLAVGALHNFICSYDPDDGETRDALEVAWKSPPATPEHLMQRNITQEENAIASARQETIAKEMWAQYEEYLHSDNWTKVISIKCNVKVICISKKRVKIWTNLI